MKDGPRVGARRSSPVGQHEAGFLLRGMRCLARLMRWPIVASGTKNAHRDLGRW